VILSFAGNEVKKNQKLHIKKTQMFFPEKRRKINQPISDELGV